jgi:hypothetical protein
MEKDFKLQYLKAFADQHCKEIQKQLLIEVGYVFDENDNIVRDVDEVERWRYPFDKFNEACKSWPYFDITRFCIDFTLCTGCGISERYYLDGDREIDVFYKAMHDKFKPLKF